MRGLRILAVGLFALLLCANVALAVEPWEARGRWAGLKIWVDGSTGNFVDFSGRYSFHSYQGLASTDNAVMIGQGRTNALWIKNDSRTQSIFVKPNGCATHSTADVDNYASASMADWEVKAGESLWLEPWITSRVEVTGSTGIIDQGDVRIYGLFTE